MRFFNVQISKVINPVSIFALLIGLSSINCADLFPCTFKDGYKEKHPKECAPSETVQAPTCSNVWTFCMQEIVDPAYTTCFTGCAPSYYDGKTIPKLDQFGCGSSTENLTPTATPEEVAKAQCEDTCCVTKHTDSTIGIPACEALVEECEIEQAEAAEEE